MTCRMPGMMQISTPPRMKFRADFLYNKGGTHERTWRLWVELDGKISSKMSALEIARWKNLVYIFS